MKKRVLISALVFAAGLLNAGGDSMEKDALKQYRKRRNLERSPEPVGRVKKRRSRKLLFVIQKHAARSLHYDVRLEIDGVLVSWAVPKGPSTNPRVKRLAIRTDDHPIEYAKFEGVIPEDSYGAGTVMIWDIGTYENIKMNDDGELVPMGQCLKRGRIEVFLTGEKLQGGYAFIKTALSGNDQWLMIKMRDAYADARRNPVSTEQKSAVTNRTMTEIKQDEGKRTRKRKAPSCKC